jgi:hypothetical protein
VDTSAKLAVESLLVGLHKARAIDDAQLGIVLAELENAGASAKNNTAAAEQAVTSISDNVRYLTGLSSRPGPGNQRE